MWFQKIFRGCASDPNLSFFIQLSAPGHLQNSLNMPRSPYFRQTHTRFYPSSTGTWFFERTHPITIVNCAPVSCLKLSLKCPYLPKFANVCSHFFSNIARLVQLSAQYSCIPNPIWLSMGACIKTDKH